MAINPLKIHLVNVTLTNETISLEGKDEIKESLEFGVEHEMMHNLEEKKIKYGIRVNFLDSKKNTIADINYDFFFEVDDLEENYQIINNKPLFDGQFVAALLGIVYSTTRGVLLSKFENTPLKNQLLPVINVPDLISNNR